MRIAQIAPPWISVPPKTYGGTELVISWLTEELVKRGHQVTLFATGDSKTKANLIPMWPKGLWGANLSAPHAVFSLLYRELLQRADDFDIIHDHCEFYTSPYTKLLKAPVITTLHHPLNEETIMLYKKFPNVHYVAISKNQKKSASAINFARTIYHGLPIIQYPFNPEPQDYLLWISKIIPQKGLAEAIEVALATGQNLVISGYLPPEYKDYFEYRIKPMIDNKQIRFVGASNFEKKIDLFQNAKALLFPVKRPEPFGLVVIESMACGTPVIAYKAGSMPELIVDGKTGFLTSSKEEMIEAVGKIGQISRIVCHRHVARKFSRKKMVNKYEMLYQTILKERRRFPFIRFPF